MASEVRQLTLIKKRQTYIFRYLQEEKDQLLQELIRKAEDPECSLDWFEVAILAQQMSPGFSPETQRHLEEKLDEHGFFKQQELF